MAVPLEARLALVARWCGPFEAVADIGAGAGRLSRYLARLGHRVWAVERRPTGVRVLAQAVAGYEAVTVLAGDGFSPLQVVPQAAVVAGMGGTTIARIIQHAPPGMALILQPMQGWRRLREELGKGRWRLLNAALVFENGRFYPTWMVKAMTVASVWHPLLPAEFRGEPYYGAWLGEVLRRRARRLTDHRAELSFYEALEEELGRWTGPHFTGAWDRTSKELRG